MLETGSRGARDWLEREDGGTLEAQALWRGVSQRLSLVFTLAPPCVGRSGRLSSLARSEQCT